MSRVWLMIGLNSLNVPEVQGWEMLVFHPQCKIVNILILIYITRHYELLSLYSRNVMPSENMLPNV